MKKLILFLTSSLFLLPSLKAQKTITIANPTSEQRSELIAISAVHYADPTIDPARHQTQIYVALLFPDEVVTIRQQEKHALGILKNCISDRRFHYFFGAAWSEFDVSSQAEWQLRIEGFIQARKHPLQVTVK
jgi:hypothetical protein